MEIYLRSGRSTEVIEMLLDDVVQLGVASGPVVHNQIKTLTAFDDELAAIVGPQHRYAQRRDAAGLLLPVTPQELATQEFIVARWGPSFELFMSRLSDVARRPSISMEIGVTETAKAMLKMSNGVSVLPRFAIQNELHSGTSGGTSNCRLEAHPDSNCYDAPPRPRVEFAQLAIFGIVATIYLALPFCKRLGAYYARKNFGKTDNVGRSGNVGD